MKDFSEVWPGLQSLSCERLSSNADNPPLYAYLDTISGASDLSDDDRRLVDLIREKLIHYYADQLNFEVPEDLATAKPIYDFSCKFMCQQVKGLEDGRNTFFANFNPDEV